MNKYANFSAYLSSSFHRRCKFCKLLPRLIRISSAFLALFCCITNLNKKLSIRLFGATLWLTATSGITQVLGWYSPLVDATTSSHCYRVFTGCGSLNELRSGWRYSPTAVSTVQHPSTYRDNCSESLMSACGGDFAPRRPLH